MTTTPIHTTATRRRTRRTAILAGMSAVAMSTAVAGGLTASAAEATASDAVDTIEVDVAEDGTRFVMADAPVFDDGFPAHGNAFVTQGYIYPAGTLDDSNGVNADGSPEFPDEVIGEWSCSGYFIGEAAHATEGAWVYTTQLFAFGDDADNGADTIVVTGYEGAEVGAMVTGAITGGTGGYAAASGEAHQVLIGINNPELPTMGINKTVELNVNRR